MSFKITLDASIKIEDTSGASPAIVIEKAKTDEKEAQTEFQVLEVTVPASATDQVVDLSNFDTQSLYIQTTQPLTMLLPDPGPPADEPIPVQSLAVLTFAVGQGPASLRFSNAGAVDAQVYIALGSV